MEFPEVRYHGIPQSTTPNALVEANALNFASFELLHSKKKMERKKALVKNPNNCVVLCSGCDSICPAGTIKHPSKKEFRENIKALRRES